MSEQLRKNYAMHGALAHMPSDRKVAGRPRNASWVPRILNTIRGLNHPTKDEIHRWTNGGGDRKRTWARLESLVQAGLLIKTIVSRPDDSGKRQQQALYEAREGRHCHIICVRCGRIADGKALRDMWGLRQLFEEMRTQVAARQGLATNLRIEVDFICVNCQTAEERSYANESRGITKQLAQDLNLAAMPEGFYWPRKHAVSLRAKAGALAAELEDRGTMMREQQPWEYHWSVHRQCGHCQHFVVDDLQPPKVDAKAQNQAA